MEIKIGIREVTKIADKTENKGLLFILGDWNARLVYPIPEDRREIMGKYTMRSSVILHSAECMRESRHLCIEFRAANNSTVTGALCRKPLSEVAMYRKKKGN